MQTSHSPDAPLRVEVPALARTNGWLPLSALAVLRARGADAATFLQGQLTQDVARLGVSDSALAGYCSAKGRLLASFLMWKDAGDDLTLLCSADLAASTVKRLSMFVMRAQCKITDESAAIPLWALFGPEAAAALGPDAPLQVYGRNRFDRLQVLRLPSPADPADGGAAFLMAGPMDAVQQRWPALSVWMNGQPPLGPQAWTARMIDAGVPWIVAATQEQFVPQMVNLELLAGVNFQKGCYPGQEVVARSQYRGTLKRRMIRLSVDAAAHAGQDLVHSADPDQPAGKVVNAVADGNAGSWLLAEVKLASLESGTLHLGAADGPTLTPGALPYGVPELSLTAEPAG